MRISVFLKDKHSRTNTGCYRTSDGYFWGYTHERECIVYVENHNISIEEARIIYNFIKSYSFVDKDSRSDGPENMISNFEYSEYHTNCLLKLLTKGKYINTNDMEGLIEAFPIVTQIIKEAKCNDLTYVINKTKKISQYIETLIHDEKIYIRAILSKVIHPNNLLEISKPEKLNAINILLDWRDIAIDLILRNENSGYINRQNIGGNNREISILNATIYKFSEYKLKDIFYHEDKWCGYPIDIAIYIEDLDALKELLNINATTLINKKGFHAFCLKHNDEFLLNHKLFKEINEK